MNLVEEVNGIYGRDKEILELSDSLNKGANILLKAPMGYGKKELYQYLIGLADDYDWFYLELEDMLYASGAKGLIREYHSKYYDQFYLHPNTLNQLSDTARKKINRTGKVTWPDLSRHITRDNLEYINKILFYSLHWRNKNQEIITHKPILFVKNIKRITEGNMAMFSVLFQQFQVIAILDRRYAHLPHLTILANNFQTVYELNPIPFDACKSIVIEWLKYNPIEFKDDDVRESYIKHIARDCGGSPGVITKLLEKALLESKEISKDSVRRYESDNVQYISMYPVGMIIVAIGSAMRMLGRELDDPVLIITGIISGVLLLVMFLLRSTIDKVPKN